MLIHVLGGMLACAGLVVCLPVAEAENSVEEASGELEDCFPSETDAEGSEPGDTELDNGSDEEWD